MVCVSQTETLPTRGVDTIATASNTGKEPAGVQ